MDAVEVNLCWGGHDGSLCEEEYDLYQAMPSGIAYVPQFVSGYAFRRSLRAAVRIRLCLQA
jgi:hypothetical protein